MRSMIALTRRGLMAAALASFAMAPMPQAAAAQEMRKVTVLRSPVGQFQGLYIAQERGYFRDRGLEVEIMEGGAADQNVARLMSGQADIAMTGSLPLINAVNNGLPILAMLNNQDQGDPQTLGLVVAPDSPFQALPDLAGRSVGLPGVNSPQGLALSLALEKAGIDPASVKRVNLPMDSTVEAIRRGTVDAGIPVALFYELALQQGFREFPEVFEQIRGLAAVIFVARKDWLEKNAETARLFNEAMLEAYDDLNAHPDDVRRIDIAHTRLPKEFLLTRRLPVQVGTIDVARWITLNGEAARLGMISASPPAEAFIWSGAPRR